MSDDQAHHKKMAALLQAPHSAASWTDYRNPQEEARADFAFNFSYPHLSPGSTMVAPIGTNWSPGAWERVVNMIIYARGEGFNVWLEEIRDSCASPPYEGVPEMRDTAVMLAQARGFEWLCMVENDVMPEPELLVNLIHREMSVIGPRIIDPGNTAQCIGFPDWEAGTGVRPMRWLPYSFMLFKVAVFNCFGAPPFTTFAQRSEGNLALGLARYGHRVWQDTDRDMEIARPPSYRAKSYEEHIERMHRADKARREPSNRKPVDPSTPTVAGMYAPWWNNGANP